MNWTHEKLFFGITTLASSAFAWIGVILTEGDTRWLLITFAVSSMTSGLLSLIFRRPDETINLTAARCGFTALSGIFGSKLVAWQLEMDSVHTDPINLGGLTFLVSIFAFVVGYRALRYLEKRSDYIAQKFIDSKFNLPMDVHVTNSTADPVPTQDAGSKHAN